MQKISRQSSIFVALECAFLLIPFGVYLSQVHADDPDLGGLGGGNYSGDMSASPSDYNNKAGGGKDGTDDHSKDTGYQHDNRRNRWTWSSKDGWKLIVDEETYSNGWAWIWKDGEGWIWMRVDDRTHGWLNTRGHAAASDTQTISSSTASVAMKDDEKGCFASDESWVTDRTRCDEHQDKIREKVIEDLQSSAPSTTIDSLPEDVANQLKQALPVTETPVEHAKIVGVLDEYFAVVPQNRDKVLSGIRDVTQRLVILKDMDRVTTGEREFFLGKVTEAQAVLDGVNAPITGKDQLAAAAAKVADIARSAQTYVKNHAIMTAEAENAPSASQLFHSTKRILTALPSTLAVLKDAGISTSTFTDMLGDTQAFVEVTTVRCQTQQVGCSGVTDAVGQTQRIVSAINDAIAKNGSQTLKVNVEQAFDAALAAQK